MPHILRAVTFALLFCIASAGPVPAGVIYGAVPVPEMPELDFEVPSAPFDLPKLGADAPLWVQDSHFAAELGSPLGWMYMGLAFETGTAVEQDGEKAATSYRHALENHERDYAPLLLSRLYGLGEAVALSPALADHYARIAAIRSGERFLEAGSDRIFRKILQDDWVPRQRLRAALDWLEERKKWLHHEQFTLSLAYEHGDGVPQDYRMALYWLGKASAHHRRPEIQFYYGRCLLYGYCAEHSFLGDSRILVAKSSLHEAAALNNLPEAQLFLGTEYLAGEVLPRNLAKAYTWLHYAKRQGSELPVELDTLRGALTEAELQQARSWIDTRRYPPIT